MATFALVAVTTSAGAGRAQHANGQIVLGAAAADPAQLLTLHLPSHRSSVLRGFDGELGRPPNGLAPSPNGRYVAFVRDPQERDQTVWVARSDGSHSHLVSKGCGPTWSPDEKRLAVVSGENGWCFGETLSIVERSGTGIVSIYGRPDVTIGNPLWAPDGSWIAFLRYNGPSGDYALLAIRADGSDEHVVAEKILGNGYDWSPDGHELVFVRDTGAPGEYRPGIATVPVGGGTPLVLASDAVYKTDPRWSADGSFIAYSIAAGNVVGSNVVVVGSSGGLPKVVGEGALPRWQPKARRLAFLSPQGIVLAHPDGSGSSVVLREPMGASFWELGWFPSGSRLFFSRIVDGSRSELFQLGTGGRVKRLLPRVHAVEPSWSESGRDLAFVRVGNAGNRQLAVLRGNAKRPRTLTRNRYGWDSQPTWAPDGARIAFVRVSSWALWTKRALYVRSLTRGTARQLSDALQPDHPAWSPDGRAIVIDGLRGNQEHRGLRLVDAATGTVTDFTHPPFANAFDRIAAWSPDGREVAFVRRYTGGSVGAQDVRVATVATGQERLLVTDRSPDPFQADYLSWSPDGSRIAAAGIHGSDFGGPPVAWTMSPVGSNRAIAWQRDRDATGIAWQPR